MIEPCAIHFKSLLKGETLFIPLFGKEGPGRLWNKINAFAIVGLLPGDTCRRSCNQGGHGMKRILMVVVRRLLLIIGSGTARAEGGKKRPQQVSRCGLTTGRTTCRAWEVLHRTLLFLFGPAIEVEASE